MGWQPDPEQSGSDGLIALGVMFSAKTVKRLGEKAQRDGGIVGGEHPGAAGLE